MIIFAIETSCDETSMAIVADTKVLAHVIASQISKHQPYGGVVPQLASRLHYENLTYVWQTLWAQTSISLDQIEVVCFTKQPGLAGCLQVGSIFAKTLALLLAVPCYGINHLDAHLLAATINNDQPLLFPALGLVVSGGHTQLVLMTSYGQIKVLSATTDDACGEALDKIGRALNFSYPGGIAIAQAAACARKHRTGTPLDRYQFSAPEITHDFSFSGFKTAALQKIPRQPQAYPEFCLALEGWWVQYLIRKTEWHYDHSQASIKMLVLGGGVSANGYLRECWAGLGIRLTTKVLMPQGEYCCDNAAMIGVTCYWQKKKPLKKYFFK